MDQQADISKSGFESLYFHMPFCETKCHYCDFYSIGRERTTQQMHDDFDQGILKEIDLYQDQLGSKTQTVFFGGGTPSMTSSATLSAILEKINQLAPFSSTSEIGMEANPSSVSLEKIRTLKNAGINRISMGVQSTHDRLLKTLGRVHDEEQAYKALNAIFEAGIQNVSVDLICGVPGQSVEELQKSMDRLISYPITHLSCYLLTLPKNHFLAPQLPSDDTQLEHLLFIDQHMKSAGFEHYEISNFCRPNHRCQHNLVYWHGKSYLGLGPSAHSFDASKKLRWKNISSLEGYLKAIQKDQFPLGSTESLSDSQSDLEKWMLGLRLSDGFPKTWIDTPVREAKVKKFESESLIETHPEQTSHYRLTPRGLALSDQLISELA